MNVKRFATLLAPVAFAGAAIVSVAMASPPSQASLSIRHQTRGCHSWSLNGDAYAANQAAAIRVGGSITVTNDDVMPHQLIETSGAPVKYTRVSGGGFSRLKAFPPTMLARLGASSRITFAKAGDYRFTTKPGAGLMPNVATVGPDNVLRLTVHVSAAPPRD